MNIRFFIDPTIIVIISTILIILISIIIVFTLFKKTYRKGFDTIISEAISDPSNFKKEYISDNCKDKNKIIQQIQKFREIKKTKFIKIDDIKKILEIYLTTNNGAEHKYQIEFEKERNTFKIKDLNRLL